MKKQLFACALLCLATTNGQVYASSYIISPQQLSNTTPAQVEFKQLRWQSSGKSKSQLTGFTHLRTHNHLPFGHIDYRIQNANGESITQGRIIHRHKDEHRPVQNRRLFVIPLNIEWQADFSLSLAWHATSRHSSEGEAK